MCCWLCLVVIVAAALVVVVVMPQSLFSTFPMQRHAEFEQLSWLSNGRTPGLAWDTPLHVKDKRVFNYSSCYFHNSYPQQSLTNFSVSAGWLPAFQPIQQSCNPSIRQCFNAAKSLPFRSVQWRIKIRLPVGSSAWQPGPARRRGSVRRINSISAP